MILNSMFYLETRPLKKIALLFTIPCGILPIMMAIAGMMSTPVSPLIFKYDFLLFGVLYLIYCYGLFLSWKVHRKWVPAALLTVHLVVLSGFVSWGATSVDGICFCR